MKRRTSGLAQRLIGLSVALLLVAGCSSSLMTAGPGSGTPAPSDTAAITTGPTLGPEDSATPPPSPSDTPATLVTPGPTRGPLARGAWPHGENMLEDVLVAPYQGWVRTTRGVYQTIDDGASWANATPPRLIASKMRGLGALDANRALLAVSDTIGATTTVYVWRTTDGGANWSYVALPAFRIAATIGACGPDFQCVANPGDPTVRFDYVDQSVAFLTLTFVSGLEFEGLVQAQYSTTDGGRTWTRIHFRPGSDVYSVDGSGEDGAPWIYFQSATTGVVTSGGSAYSTNSGWGNWTRRTITAYSGADYWHELTPQLPDASNWYVSGTIDPHGTLTYAYSSNSGQTWERRSSAIPGVSGATDVRVRFIDRINWVAGVSSVSGTTTTTRVFLTGTSGANWTATGNVPSAAQPTFVDLVHGWARPHNEETSTRLYSTTDSGMTWRVITP